MSKHIHNAKAAKSVKQPLAEENGAVKEDAQAAASDLGEREASAGESVASGEQVLSEERFIEILKAEFSARVAALEAENANLKDQYLRKAADFENFRKRLQRDKQDAVDFANQALLMDIIPVIDDFERAIKSSEAARDFNAFHEGVSMIAKQLLAMLGNKWGLVRYESAGQAFDPNRHEAVMVERQADITEPTVLEDFIKGFMLKDRVIRSAKVKVAMPVQEAASGQKEEEDE